MRRKELNGSVREYIPAYTINSSFYIAPRLLRNPRQQIRTRRARGLYGVEVWYGEPSIVLSLIDNGDGDISTTTR